MKRSGFWKESFASSAAALVRVACSFLTNKFLASVMGPAGFAVVGQLQSLITLGQGTSSLALQNGWVSLSARYKNDEAKLGPIWRGGFRISVYASLLTAVGIALFAFVAPLETLFPGVPTRAMQAAILFAIPGIVALTGASVCSSVLNGLSDYRRWTILTMVSSAMNCAWVILMVESRSLSVLSAVATQSVLSCVYALVIAHRGGFTYKRFRATIVPDFKSWKGYAAMGIIPMVLSPVLYIAVRSFLGTRFGWDAAGFWQGATRISDFFNVGFSSVLGVVLLPRLSSVKSAADFRSVLSASLVRVLAIAFALVTILFFARDFVIAITLSERFLSLSSLLPIQLVGDFFRCGCWCLGLALIARKETVAFLIVETGADLLFFLFALSGSIVFGYRSPFVAYAVENALCFVALFIVSRRLPWKTL